MSLPYRVGYGEDIHVLVPNRKLILGGVEIPYELGLLGHSDADVVYHALSDALLGALSLGDIGKYFPPSDPKWEGMDSSLILAEVVRMVKEKGYAFGNADLAISCEKPHLAKHIEKMKSNIAAVIGCDPDDIGIQAMTAEKMGPVGEGKAIRVSAVVIIGKENANG